MLERKDQRVWLSVDSRVFNGVGVDALELVPYTAVLDAFA